MEWMMVSRNRPKICKNMASFWTILPVCGFYNESAETGVPPQKTDRRFDDPPLPCRRSRAQTPYPSKGACCSRTTPPCPPPKSSKAHKKPVRPFRAAAPKRPFAGGGTVTQPMQFHVDFDVPIPFAPWQSSLRFISTSQTPQL